MSEVNKKLFSQQSTNKNMYVQARLKLKMMIQSMNTPEYYHYTAYDLGVFNGLLLAEAIILGKEPKQTALVPKPKDGIWGIQKEQKKEVQNERPSNSNVQCERSDNTPSSGSPELDREESSSGIQGEHGSNSDRPPSERSSEEVASDEKENSEENKREDGNV